MFNFKFIGKCLVIGFSCSLFFNKVSAQTVTTSKTKTVTETPSPYENAPYQVVKIDLNSQTFLSVLPFDVPFLILGDADAKLLSVTGEFKIGDGTATKLTKWNARVEDKPYLFMVPRLKPNTVYTFNFKFERKLTESEKTQLIAYTNKILRPMIDAKIADGNDPYEFSAGERNHIFSNIKSAIEAFLKKKDLNIDMSNYSDDNMKANLNAIKTLSLAYERNRIDKLNIEDGIDLLKNDQKTDLTTLRGQYDAATKASVAKTTYLAYMASLIAAVDQVIDFPVGKQLLDDALVTSFKKSLSDFLIVVNSNASKPNKDITKLKGHIINNVAKIAADFDTYIATYKEANAATIIQNEALVNTVAEVVFNDAIVNGNSVNNFETRAKNYFSLDLGVAAIPQLNKLVPYIGTNIYFRPVNKERPLLWSDGWDQVGRRFSFLLGLSVTSLAETGVREDLFGGNFNLITGAGFRVADAIRLSGGLLWCKEVNSNPLIVKSSVRSKPFISLSFDIDVKTVFNQLFTPAHISTFQ